MTQLESRQWEKYFHVMLSPWVEAADACCILHCAQLGCIESTYWWLFWKPKGLKSNVETNKPGLCDKHVEQHKMRVHSNTWGTVDSLKARFGVKLGREYLWFQTYMQLSCDIFPLQDGVLCCIILSVLYLLGTDHRANISTSPDQEILLTSVFPSQK